MTTTALAIPVLLLKLALSAVILFSSAIIVLPEPTQALFDFIAFGPGDDQPAVPPAARPYVVFVYGVLAAVMIGWMVALAGIVHIPLRRGEPWAWWVVTLSVGSWFAIDTGLSLARGFAGNAVLNLVVAALFAWPLIASRRLVTDRAGAA